eukprot:SAG25_NODE_8605_length_413_cov_1.468153_2_plen_38_part_01
MHHTVVLWLLLLRVVQRESAEPESDVWPRSPTWAWRAA